MSVVRVQLHSKYMEKAYVKHTNCGCGKYGHSQAFLL